MRLKLHMHNFYYLQNLLYTDLDPYALRIFSAAVSRFADFTQHIQSNIFAQDIRVGSRHPVDVKIQSATCYSKQQHSQF